MTLLRVEHKNSVCYFCGQATDVKIPMTLLRVEHSFDGKRFDALPGSEDSDDSVKS